jgi:nucleoside-diphosphate-sugar epimerase
MIGFLMRIFLTGATGHIGSSVLDALIKSGHQVTAIARDPEKAEGLLSRGATPIIGELGMPKTYIDAVRVADGVVHAAFESSARGVQLDRQAVETMLQAQGEAHLRDGRMRTFIYTSGIWVLGRTVKAAEEDAPLDPAPNVAWRPAHEDVVLSAFSGGLRTVVGPGKNRWPCIYDRDLGELYVKILESPMAAGIFHATDEADERVVDIVEAIAAQVSQRPDIRNMPMAEARKKLGTYADALALDQKVRSPKARALGWAPSQPGVVQSVARLLEEFRNAKRERS